jgi:hypothetical protein
MDMQGKRVAFGSVRRLVFGALVTATIAGGAMTAPGTAAAAVVGMGTGYAASVTCDSFGGLITLTASASAAPTFNYGQTIAYQYWVYDETARATVRGLDPTGFGYFSHVRYNSNGSVTWQNANAFSGDSYFVLTRGHAYTVWTRYLFWNGSTWLDFGYVKTAWYKNLNLGSTNNYCLM